MALGDWNQYGDTSRISLDTGTKNEGKSSLKINAASDTLVALIWGQSETDAPNESQVQTDLKMGGSRRMWANFHRWQDANNFLAVVYTYDPAPSAGQFQLWERNGGTYSELASTTPNDVQGGWFTWRSSIWIDANNDFRVRIEEDNNKDGTWNQLGNDMVASPSITSGGGVGVGIDRLTYADNLWYDLTEPYY